MHLGEKNEIFRQAKISGYTVHVNAVENQKFSIHVHACIVISSQKILSCCGTPLKQVPMRPIVDKETL